MKNNIILLFSVISLLITSCTDVIDVEVQNTPPRLTIEASLDWEKGTAGNEQTIKLSTSTPYFDQTTPTAVTGASVKVTNNNSGQEFVFADQNDGRYTTSSFIPVLNQAYILEVIHEGETYTATETLMPVVDITAITQSTEKGFSEEDLELNVHFTDPEEETNYYLFRFYEQGDRLPYLETAKDEFVNGNEISWYFEKDDDEENQIEAFVPGDVVDITFFGISEGYYNYMALLIEQSEGVGLFSPIPVALRGNCINQTNPQKYAYGYFRVAQVVRESYTFE
jgi:hypothetical protein